MFVKSYIEFIFNIKNNSIYISERIEKGFFVFKTSLEVLDTQLQPVDNGDMKKHLLNTQKHFYIINPFRTLEIIQTLKNAPSRSLLDSNIIICLNSEFT